MPRAICDVEHSGSAAARARRFARATLRDWHLDALTIEAEMVATELVTNAVLHGVPPVFVELTYEGKAVRIAVGDGSPAPPVTGLAASDSMTGRGLQLVAALSTRWGVTSADGARPGKLVWAELAIGDASGVSARPRRATLMPDGEAVPDAGQPLVPEAGSVPDADPAADPAGDSAGGDEQRYEIVLGDVPTDLLAAAKAHVDNIVRELLLASYESPADTESGRPGHLGGQLAELVRDVVVGFSEVRQAIKRQALAALARGDERTTLSLSVGISLADAGERYLAALDEVDSYARVARLLTVESPPQHRAFRHWYVQSLVDQLRAKGRGEKPVPPPSFERFLLGEVASIALAHRVSDLAARLQRVTAALAGALTPADVANVTVAECVRTLDASGGALLLSDDTGLLTVAGGSTAGPLPWAILDEVRSSGRPRFIEGVSAACAVPIAVGGEVLGVLVLSYASTRIFDADDRAFIEAVAAEAGQTLTRTRLHEEQVRLAERLARLQSVAAELAHRSDLAGVCEAAVRHATAAVDAHIGSVCLPTSDGQRLRICEVLGGDLGEDERWREFSIAGAFPASEAFRRGEPVVVDGSNHDLPEFAGYPRVDHVLVCLPLRVDDEVNGVLTLSFPNERRLNAADLTYLAALADVCAQALARAQALESVTRVSNRFAFLAEASRQLAVSLNYEETLQAVAELAVPQLADWCGIDLLERDEIRAVAVAHVDPRKSAFARNYRAMYPEPPDSGAGVSRVITSGESLLVSGITDDMLVARARDERELAMLRELGMSAVLIVPLRAGGRVVGALSMIRSNPARPFTAGDVTLAEDLGGRAGTAVENARLFREVQASWHSDSGTSHARLDLALTAASIGSFDWDLRGGSLTLDDRACTVLGVDRRDFDERPETVFGSIVAQDRAGVEAAIERAAARLGDFSAEYRIRRPDGVVRWIDSRGRVLPGPDGRASRMIGVAFDSTELREARDRVARTLEHMGDAFISLDGEWRVTYVNATAERMLGRERASLLGRNLWEQLPDTIGSVDERAYRRALETQRPVTFERYVAASGHTFEVRVQPIPEGLGVYFTDISESRQFEQERAELREASRHARSIADVARARLAFIAEVSSDITMTLDPVEVCRRLAAHAVGRLADWVSVYVLDGDQCHRIAAAHRDPRWAQAVSELVDNYPIDVSSDAMVARAVRTKTAVLEQHMHEKQVNDTYPDPGGRAVVEGMGVSSAFVIPMIARNEVVGVMAFIRSDPENEFEPDELQLAATLASRAALAVQNAQLYARQTTVAQALQQAVLPEALPILDTVKLVARYEPALDGAGVGGDFYDVFRLPTGRVALAVGDAAGHGLQAGALMGQLRNALRAYAVQERGPAVTLRSLSELIAGLEPDAFATAFYAELDPDTGELVWASAGHPPPVLTFPGGTPRYLEGVPSPPLGIFTESDVDGGRLVLPPGGGIFMYTDGLVERRRVDISDGLDALRLLVGAHQDQITCVDAVVNGMREESGYADDVCVLFAVRSS